MEVCAPFSAILFFSSGFKKIHEVEWIPLAIKSPTLCTFDEGDQFRNEHLRLILPQIIEYFCVVWALHEKVIHRHVLHFKQSIQDPKENIRLKESIHPNCRTFTIDTPTHEPTLSAFSKEPDHHLRGARSWI